ncbi:MAG TPA: glycosyltransferase family 9 protein [Abditibacteriaceae bacterium]|jgi:lipopolysaccharide heptosyltransferase II
MPFSKSPKKKINANSGASAAVLTGAAPSQSLALSVPVRRIATFHLNGLGDLLFTLPALAALRESFPGAKIHAVVRPGLAPLLEASPFVDEILLRAKGGLTNQTSLLMQLRARHLDVCVAFSQSRNTTMLAWSSGAPMRIGYEGAKMEALLTHHVPKEHAPYTIESHLDIARAMGCPAHDRDYHGLLHLPLSAGARADAILQEAGISGPFVVAACEASARRGIKEWPEEHWAQALDTLAARLPVVLVGTQQTESVRAKMKQPVFDAGGRTDLQTLAALCGRARLFLGIDSGVLHLAAAMGTPVVGIYGPSSWKLTSPRGVPQRIVRHPVECSPCLLSECPLKNGEHKKCLTRLAPESVVVAARELIGV